MRTDRGQGRGWLRGTTSRAPRHRPRMIRPLQCQVKHACGHRPPRWHPDPGRRTAYRRSRIPLARTGPDHCHDPSPDGRGQRWPSFDQENEVGRGMAGLVRQMRGKPTRGLTQVLVVSQVDRIGALTLNQRVVGSSPMGGTPARRRQVPPGGVFVLLPQEFATIRREGGLRRFRIEDAAIVPPPHRPGASPPPGFELPVDVPRAAFDGRRSIARSRLARNQIGNYI